jgi:FKBP-type peptidyl-prolyl cis-trans isomerase SlyD
MNIAQDSVVSIHYTLKNPEGEVIDSSDGGDPLVYLHGAGNIIPGLENALIGKAVDDELEVVVAPGEGYGDYNQELLQKVPLSAFEGVDSVEVGAQFQASTANGPINVVVVDVEDEHATLDGNHPLAGVELHFAVKIAAIREASAEEKDHGHAH